MSRHLFAGAPASGLSPLPVPDQQVGQRRDLEQLVHGVRRVDETEGRAHGDGELVRLDEHAEGRRVDVRDSGHVHHDRDPRRQAVEQPAPELRGVGEVELADEAEVRPAVQVHERDLVRSIRHEAPPKAVSNENATALLCERGL